MARASKCDLCKTLYETTDEHQYAGFTVQKEHGRRDVQVQIALLPSSYYRQHDKVNTESPLEVCRECTKDGVRKLMRHLGIKEENGG